MSWHTMDTAPKDGAALIVRGSMNFRGNTPMIAFAWRDDDDPSLWWSENNGGFELIFPMLWTRDVDRIEDLELDPRA